MIQVQSHNNNGLLSRKKKNRYARRLFIRRSKIYPSITNNSFSQSYPYEKNLIVNYRPQIRHRRIRRKRFNGAGDEKIITPSPSTDQKHIDFTELEQIFDNAIRNRYKEKPQTKNVILTQDEHPPKPLESVRNNNLTDIRIELSTVEPIEEIQCCLLSNIKQHKILSAIIFITLSAFLGFFSVFIFVIK